MKKTLIIFAVIFSIGTLLSILYPYYMVNPGVLMGGHAKLQSDCMACHTVLQNAPNEKCIRCHNLTSIGRAKVDGTSLSQLNQRSNIIHNALAADCVTCHSEHNGKTAGKASQHFSHNALSAQIMQSCLPCHAAQKPNNPIHNRVIVDCSQCHSTTNWKPAHFDHSFSGANNSDCLPCHNKDIPDDELHSQTVRSTPCQKCHGVEYWKPTIFDHSKYFAFDENHPSDCSNCHNVKSGLNSYTCYNCHEHTPARISEKHLEEGIASFENCVKCHRSGNEHDMEYDNEGGERKNREEHDDD